MTSAMPVALILSYPLLVHLAVWLELPVIQVLALLVLALGLFLPGLRQGSRFTWGLFFLVLVLLCTVGYLDIAIYLLYLPPVVIPLLFWGVFLHSLLPGKVPLVTAIGERARGPLSAQMRRYTRGVTLMWTVFFAVLALWSALLPWLLTNMQWSLFTNFINYLLVVLLFVAEFVYRKWRFQDHDHPGFLDYLKIVVNADIRKR
ncbi:MAG: hypothetical protein L3J88_03715 [Gammaproteobacteria bacterium]|nr:hypothetical protein [Gammaproteobacteria bacterium]MCF6362456.1 hypothetical protein [Gammaproteobacteria bacterium]